MKQVSFIIPKGIDCRVVGCLYDSDDKDDLSDEMLEVVFEKDYLITAGWLGNETFGPYGPNIQGMGQYVIEISYGWDSLEICVAENVNEAAHIITKMLEHYSKQTINWQENGF